MVTYSSGQAKAVGINRKPMVQRGITFETVANSKQLWPMLFNHLSTAVHLKTLDGQWIYANNASYRLWQHSALTGEQNRPKTDRELLPSAQLASFARADAEVISHRSHVEFTTQHSPGESHIFVRKSLICLTAENPLLLTECWKTTHRYHHHAARDTDALDDALNELQQTQLQLVQHEKMSSLGQLMAGVAHEINNPVNFIYGNIRHAQAYVEELIELVNAYRYAYSQPMREVQALLDGMDLDFLSADLPKVLTSMRVGAERIRAIVSSLRIFSRMDEADMKTVNLHDGLNSTLMILEHRFKSKPQRCAIVVQKNYGDLPLVECYAGQLNQVFMNLLVNAIDAIEEAMDERNASLPLSITISTQLEQQHVIIAIHNDGPGIPAHIQPRLFDPFFTTKPVGKGTGMGLSISYQIVSERHGGQLTCESSNDRGTTFKIMIPVHQNRVLTTPG